MEFAREELPVAVWSVLGVFGGAGVVPLEVFGVVDVVFGFLEPFPSDFLDLFFSQGFSLCLSHLWFSSATKDGLQNCHSYEHECFEMHRCGSIAPLDSDRWILARLMTWSEF